MTSSRHFSRSTKRAAYARSGGRCENPSCGVSLPAGWGGIEYHHGVPWTISHNSSLENCRVLCVPCHREITSSHDRPVIDKNRRLRDAAIGIKRNGKKLPGGRDTAIRITMSNGPQRRLDRGEGYRVLMAKLQPGGVK